MVSIRDRHNRIVSRLSKAIYRGDVTLDQSVPDGPSADRPDIVIRDGTNVIIIYVSEEEGRSSVFCCRVWDYTLSSDCR